MSDKPTAQGAPTPTRSVSEGDEKTLAYASGWCANEKTLAYASGWCATPATDRGAFRRLLPWLGLAGVAGLLALQADRLTDPATLGLHDYVAYWSAGRLNALGQDPYSPPGLLALQRTVGWA